MNKASSRHVIIDRPTDKDSFSGKGHERTARSLADTIKYFDNSDRAIGLDGPWGSGKSSVVEIASKHLVESQDNNGSRYHFFTFDIWQSQGTDFRRSFLEHFIAWAEDTFPKKNNKLEKISEDIHGKTREIETDNQPILDWFGIIVVFFIPFIPIYYFWANNVFSFYSQTDESYKFLLSPPFTLLALFALTAIITATIKMCTSWNGKNKLDFKMAMSRVLLISSRQHQDHKITQKIREIDPNDYEFNKTLRDILEVVQTETEKTVLVIDNIDRLPKNEIYEYWALVRSVFSRAHHQGHSTPSNRSITAIVPYDRSLIEGAVQSAEVSSSSNLTSLASREIFSKTFDNILSVAPPVLSNSKEFFKDKLDEALQEEISPDDTFRAYRIFCEILKNNEGKVTPRQIVSFVNDIAGLYILHDKSYKIPTIAAYIAHRDLLDDKPEILTQKEILDDNVISLSGDHDITKNLAAIVFNVEADLAFQILLDDDIAAASIKGDSEDLIQLSDSPGFDERVHDVIKNRLLELDGTTDYGNAIFNYKDLLKNYTGNSKPFLEAEFIKSFGTVNIIDVSTSESEAYIALLAFSSEYNRRNLVDKLISKAISGLNETKQLTVEKGIKMASFLGLIKSHLEAMNSTEVLTTVLSHFSIKTNTAVAFGLGANIGKFDLSFKNFSSIRIEVNQEEDSLFELVTERSDEAKIALAQFKQKNSLHSDTWIDIANKTLLFCGTDECEAETFENLIEIVCIAWQSLAKVKRTSIDTSLAFTQSQFFTNLNDAKNYQHSKANALSFFLAAQDHLGTGLSTPTRENTNRQRVTENSDMFSEFNSLLIGEAHLEENDVRIVADQAKEAARVIQPWVEFGNKNREHTTAKQVIIEIFSSPVTPKIKLIGLTSNFSYLVEVMGWNEVINVLSNFGEISFNEEVTNIQLEEIPKGFLTATFEAHGKNWIELHEAVNRQLKSVDNNEWLEHIESMDEIGQLLIEKLDTSGCKLDSGQLRNQWMQAILDVLSGKSTPNAERKSYDTLMQSLHHDYYLEICHSIREKVSDVTPETLELSIHLFPVVISDIVKSKDRLQPTEKDNILRHIFCPALEGNNQEVLKIFIEIGYSRFSDFSKHANKSTNARVNGAWETFSKSCTDHNLVEAISILIHGKRKSKSILQKILGKNT